MSERALYQLAGLLFAVLACWHAAYGYDTNRLLFSGMCAICQLLVIGTGLRGRR